MKPLIFFIHIPKTAGSTVNSYLTETLKGRDHVEHFIADDAQFRAAAETLDWMSGHVLMTTAEQRLRAVTDRPVRFFTCLREPAKQVMSHYNWLIEIHRRGPEFYDKHPEWARKMSEKIRSSGYDYTSIRANLIEFSGVFMNQQSKMVLGPDFNWNNGSLYDKLGKYEMISTGKSLPKMLSRMIGQEVAVTRSENQSAYPFDKNIFSRPDMLAMLRRRNNHDWMLYHIVSGMDCIPDA